MKKKYTSPKVRVVDLDSHVPLFCGSPDVNVKNYSHDDRLDIGGEED